LLEVSYFGTILFKGFSFIIITPSKNTKEAATLYTAIGV